jgi:HTH-type transcriptional regulator, competence development regulator
MSIQRPRSPSERGELGQYLWDLRQATGMSLRDVEEASEREVSNAYLSQMETGKITNPSPAILHQLAEVYDPRLPRNARLSCSYEKMMILAGHIRKPESKSKRRASRLPTIVQEELTADEEDELLKFLAFIRMRRGKK